MIRRGDSTGTGRRTRSSASVVLSMAGEAKDERRRVPVGTKLEGRWEVTKILGEGAFGAVYEVTKFYANFEYSVRLCITIFLTQVVDADRPGKVFALK
uniref:Protein kinase domain-containing protein n=1 Tax=Romanomermis culicivorax TaxID=13658 RepID=A0A915JMK5_ROMCU